MSSDGSGDSSRRSRSHSLRAYVSDLICNASSDEEFDALQIIEDHPEIKDYRSLVLDLAYEEFCRKKENGSPIRQQSFAQRFPEHEESLMRVLQVHQYLENAEQKKEKPKVNWPKPGDVFGGYRLVELIGRGSFAFVFIAEQLNVAERKVVLKVTRNALDEIATLGRLNHPNIVQIFTVESEVDGFTAICMPLISQVTLFDLLGELHGYGGQPETADDFVKALEFCINEREELVLDRAKLPFRANSRFIDAVLAVGVDIAKALAYSHKQKILHCDIKPTNILITPEGRSMLFDFNLSAKSNSKTGRIGGTLPYMPPEQLQALLDANYDFEATQEVDIYSFGVTLYQTLTGKLPFGDVPETATQKESAKLLLDRQKKSKISFAGVRGLNPSLKKIIAQCLSFDPKERPESAEVLVKQLETEQKAIKRTRRWMVTHPVKAMVIGLLIALLIPAGIMSWNYVAKLPYRQVAQLIDAGVRSEKELKFGEAIKHYQEALNKTKTAPEMRHEVLCHLAIVFARHRKDEDALRTVETINEDYPDQDIINSKIELPILACKQKLEEEDRARAWALHGILMDAKSNSIDDDSNLFALAIRYWLMQDIDAFDTLLPEFRKILAANPKHFGATFNLHRMIWNRDIEKEFIDDSFLQKCIDDHGDHPVLIHHLFKNAAHAVNVGDKDVDSYLELMRRYAKSGGKEDNARLAVHRLIRPDDKDYFLKELDDISFSDGPPVDMFFRLGITNPIRSIEFDGRR